MKDWKEWFKQRQLSTQSEEDRYQAYKARLIEEGFIETNPVRWVRPLQNDVDLYFIEKMGRGKGSVDASGEFYNYWDSLDWKVRNTRIKSWKGRANTWIKNNEKYKGSNTGGFVKTSAADQTAASIANRN